MRTSLAASGSQRADAGGLPIATGTQGGSTDGSSTDGGKGRAAGGDRQIAEDDGSTAGGNEYASGGRAVMRARIVAATLEILWLCQTQLVAERTI